jgi:DNA-damage-inducible protein J
MAKEAMIRARTDLQLKEKVEKIFQRLGLSASSAINIFYKQVALNNGLPFEVKIPNATTVKAMKTAEKGKTVSGFKSKKALFDSLNS